ncbi:MAG: hypothetical protein ABEJ70_02935 [Halobacteriaceae archaeon]
MARIEVGARRRYATMTDVEAAVLSAVEEADGAGFAALAGRVDADVGTVFRACLRLEATGALRRIGPLTFAPADGGGAVDAPESTDVDRSDGDGEAADADGPDDEADRADRDAAFEWVADDDLSG